MAILQRSLQRGRRSGRDTDGRMPCASRCHELIDEVRALLGIDRRRGSRRVTRSTIHAIIEDGPRAGETVQLDAAHEGVPPREFLLADEHLGPRTAEHRKAPSGSVSTYRLVGRDEERDGYVYRLAPRD